MIDKVRDSWKDAGSQFEQGFPHFLYGYIL